MADREKVIKALECRKMADKRCGNPCERTGFCHYAEAIRGIDGEIYMPFVCDKERICNDAIELLTEQKSLLGIQQTAESITFISTGDAQQGEERGILLGKSAMHEWIKKELIHRGLMTDEIRAVFRDATKI